METAQRNVVIVTPTKSMGIALLLTFLFGPLGMFYVTIPGGIIMSIVALLCGIITVVTAGLGIILFPFLVWLPCIIWTIVATKRYNKKLLTGQKSY